MKRIISRLLILTILFSSVSVFSEDIADTNSNNEQSSLIQNTENNSTDDKENNVDKSEATIDDISESSNKTEDVDEKIKVYFTLYGDDIHGETDEPHTLRKKNLLTWIRKTAYEIEYDSTVYDLIELAFDDKGFVCDNNGGTYISAVNGLAAFDNGINSGWMYTVNKEFPSLGIAEQELEDGDSVVLFYTDDWTKEDCFLEEDLSDDDLEQESDNEKSDNTNGFTGSSSQGNYSNKNDTSVTKIDYNSIIDDTVKSVINLVQNPTVNQIGGEWAILGLARSGAEIPQKYYDDYYNNVLSYLKEKNGILSDRKYTEYSRVIIALTAIKKNPFDVSGFDLVSPLMDYDKTVSQGVNGAAFALIALNCTGCAVSQEEKYINYILSKQKTDGGWALSDSAEISDIDITAMTLQALSKFKDEENVSVAIDKAVNYIKKSICENSEFSSWNTESSESYSQVIVALCELGISPYEFKFLHSNKTVVDKLLEFYIQEQGFLHHKLDSHINQMATEQALYALVALKRFENNENSLYSMMSKAQNEDIVIKIPNETKSGKSFYDVVGHKAKNEILSLASREIVNGKTNDFFEPDCEMTRAEFATILVRSLSLPNRISRFFKDVKSDDWFFDYLNTGVAFGIIKGVSDIEANPNGTISVEEAAVMVARTLTVCKINTEVNDEDISSTVAEFSDFDEVADWAKADIVFCLKNGILDRNKLICPKKAVLRAEVATMIYNMLIASKLL